MTIALHYNGFLVEPHLVKPALRIIREVVDLPVPDNLIQHFSLLAKNMASFDYMCFVLYPVVDPEF